MKNNPLMTHTRFTSVLVLAACLLQAFVTMSCSKDNEVKTAASEPDDTRLKTKALDLSNVSKEAIDINDDGKIDQTRYFVTLKNDEKQLKYVTHDINFDGIIDITEFYEDNVRVRDEIDLDYDGVCDLIISYKNGVISKKEYSVDFEGNRYGVQLFDEKGNRVQIQRDTNNDGKMDVIEYYNPGEDEPYKVDDAAQIE